MAKQLWRLPQDSSVEEMEGKWGNISPYSGSQRGLNGGGHEVRVHRGKGAARENLHVHLQREIEKGLVLVNSAFSTHYP